MPGKFHLSVTSEPERLPGLDFDDGCWLEVLSQIIIRILTPLDRHSPGDKTLSRSAIYALCRISNVVVRVCRVPYGDCPNVESSEAPR